MAFGPEFSVTVKWRYDAMTVCGFTGCDSPASQQVRTVRECLYAGAESRLFFACDGHEARSPKPSVCPACGVQGYGYLIPVGSAEADSVS